MKRELLLAILGKYRHLGTKYIPQTEAILIGHAPHIGSEAWLNSMYETLSESDVEAMEKSMGQKSLPNIVTFF